MRCARPAPSRSEEDRSESSCHSATVAQATARRIHLSLPPMGPFVSLPPSLHARTHTCFPTFHASVLIQAPCQALGTKGCKGARGKAVMTTQYGKCHSGHTDRGPEERVRVRGPAHLKSAEGASDHLARGSADSCPPLTGGCLGF